MKIVPALLLDIVEEVTTGKMSFDLRGRLSEVRIVFDDRDKAHAVVRMSTDGHAHQMFNVQLDKGEGDASSKSDS